ncbi:glycosyltransferase [bacterium]|nr:MAG: glycosyltransferase [bacterium]
MKILCVTGTLAGGGAERQLVNLARGFKEGGHEVSFLVLGHSAETNFYGHLLEEAGVPLIVAGLGGTLPDKMLSRFTLGRILARSLRIRRRIKEFDADVVLSFLWPANLQVIFAGFPLRSWGLAVGERSANEAFFHSRKGRSVLSAYRFADAVVTNSFANAKMIAGVRPFLSPKLHTIYNSVDFDTFKPSPEYTPRQGGKTLIVVAATLRSLKNAGRLAQAIASLEPECREKLRVEWYGHRSSTEPKEYDEVRKTISGLGIGEQFRLMGPSNEIAKAYRQADFVGLFSVLEGLPNGVCEGMACGKPILTSDVSDARKLVEEGRNGFVCDPLDVASIAGVLRFAVRAKDEEILEMGRCSREKAERLFGGGSAVSKYAGLLAGLVRKPRQANLK